MCERHTKLTINGVAWPKIIFIDISTARAKMFFQCKHSVDEKELQECCEGLNIYPIKNVFMKCSRCRCVVEARVKLPSDVLVKLCC
jgi:hypothetical protein